jgi:hypothetical protein
MFREYRLQPENLDFVVCVFQRESMGDFSVEIDVQSYYLTNVDSRRVYRRGKSGAENIAELLLSKCMLLLKVLLIGCEEARACKSFVLVFVSVSA